MPPPTITVLFIAVAHFNKLLSEGDPRGLLGFTVETGGDYFQDQDIEGDERAAVTYVTSKV
jgi:hypothetical protein